MWVMVEMGLELEIINCEIEVWFVVFGCLLLVGCEMCLVVLFDIGGGLLEIVVIKMGENCFVWFVNYIMYWMLFFVGVVMFFEWYGGWDVMFVVFDVMV